MREVKPLNDKILVKVEPVKEKTDGGLLIPDVAKDATTTGNVISVGEGVLLQDGTIRPLPLVKGDKVLFMPNVGIEIKLEDGDYKIITIRDVLGKVVE